MQFEFFQPYRGEQKACRWLCSLDFFQSSAMRTFFGPTQQNKNLQSGPAAWTCSVIWRKIKGLQMALWLGLFQSSAVWTFFGPTKWSEELTGKSAFWTFSVLQERMEGLQMALQLGFFQSAAVWAFFRSYEVEQKTCRVKLRVGVFHSYTRE